MEEETPQDVIEAPIEEAPPPMPEPEPAPAPEPEVIPATPARMSEPPTYHSSGAAPAAGAQCTIATCLLQTGPQYAGEPVVQIPFGSAITLLGDAQPDDYNRLWQQVSFEEHTGYIQRQNIRTA